MEAKASDHGRIRESATKLWPLNSMKSVEWASEMLKINQRTGVRGKNQCRPVELVKIFGG